MLTWSQNVRQWRNEIKASYSHLLEERAKITKALRLKQLDVKQDEEMRIIDAEKRQQEKAERQQQEARARQEEQDG